MTTDITELAQRLKLEVHRAVSNFNPQMNIKTRDLKELVEALEKAQSAKRTLESLGYTDNGGELWRPPIGPKPNFSLMDSYRHRIAELESRTVSAAAADVLAERQRQVTAKGWTPEHDDEYQHCEMAVAAACYIMADDDPRADVPELWPWPSEWWKPTDVRRDLVKAGALILAEIERLDRRWHQVGG